MSGAIAMGGNNISGAGTIAATTLTGTAGTLTGLTGLGIRDTSAAFDVNVAAVSSTALTAGRTLTIDVVNAARTLKLGANLTLASDPGAVTGALKSNGTGTFAAAACADLSNATTACSTAIGTSGATIPLLNGTNSFSGVTTITNATAGGSGTCALVLMAGGASIAGLTYIGGSNGVLLDGGNQQILLGGVAAMTRNGGTGVITIKANAGGITLTPNGSVTVTSLASSAGAGGLNVCIDSSGVLYKKASCP